MTEELAPISKRIPIKKHRLVIDEYFKSNMNQTKAYQNIYGGDYDSARSNAARLFANDNIQEEIERRLKESAMSADEVLMRWASMAAGDMGEFADVIALQDLKDHPKSHLVKKITSRTRVTPDGGTSHSFRIELYDAKSALDSIGKYHGLAVDKQEISGKDGGPINIKVTYESDSQAQETPPRPE